MSDAEGLAVEDALLAILKEATAGDYEIERELGRGGMAVVYLARDLALNRKVAIKTMLPELNARPAMVDRFKREAQMAAGLSHPHIIQIHTVRQTKRLVYFVMKCIEGRSIDAILAERGALDLDTTRLILQQAGSALSFAHHRGIVHRDVKPANIMIDENGWAVVTDFGIAKIEDAQNLTATGTTIGTPHYMSPEQFHNRPLTGAADQYSLGIVAFEMLTGKKPFDGGTFAEIVTKQLFSPPPDICAERPDLPAEVGAAITRMLAKEPEQRHRDLDAAIAAIGHPAPAHIDMVRANLMAIARSTEKQPPRLSSPMSPLPVTRPSGQRTVLTPVPESSASAPTPRVSPAVPAASSATSPELSARGLSRQSVPIPPAAGAKRPRTMKSRIIWALVIVAVLAVPGYFAATRLAPDRGTTAENESLARGIRLWQGGSPVLAREEFARAMRETPASAMPHVYLARIARETGDLGTARNEAGIAVRLEPGNAVALREMGSVMLAGGNYDVARRFFVRALRADPTDRASMGWLGCSLQRMGQVEQAARWLDRAGAGAWSGCRR